MSDEPHARQSDPAASATAAGELVAELIAHRRSAIARVITELERYSKLTGHLLKALAPHLSGDPIVGVTGPPGAGKSTLVNALIGHWRADGQTVGVIAVDPSSPITRGAILGDRIRMTAALDDDGVFVRSLASRGHLGGLSPAAVRAVDALDAAGFDRIVLETVGTGQSEIDVAEICDIKIVVAAPGLGDDIQAMKSGLLEIADILVVNKADRDGAEQTLQQLKGAASLHSDARQVPILKASALRGDGIAELAAAVDERRQALGNVDAHARRRRRARYLIAHAASDLIRRRIHDATDSRQLDAIADAVLDGTISPDEAAQTVLGEDFK